MLDQHDSRLSSLVKSLDDFRAPDDGFAFMLAGIKKSSEPQYVHARAAEVKHAVESLRDLHRTILIRKKSCEYLAEQVGGLPFSEKV